MEAKQSKKKIFRRKHKTKFRHGDTEGNEEGAESRGSGFSFGKDKHMGAWKRAAWDGRRIGIYKNRHGSCGESRGDTYVDGQRTRPPSPSW